MPCRSLGPRSFTLAFLALVACSHVAAVGQQLPAARVVAEYKVPQMPRPVLIPWTQNGQTFHFVIDAATPFCAVDEQVFPRLRENGTEDRIGHTGLHALVMCAAPDITVGPVKFAELKQVAKSDLSALSQVVGRRIGGIIGTDALRSFVVQFDFDGGRIRFIKPDAGPHEEWGDKVPLIPGTRFPSCVRATVDGQAADFVLDTADSGDGFLPDWWVDRLAKSSKIVTCFAATQNGSSKTGVSEFRLLRAKDCELSGVHHRDLLLSESKYPRPGLGIRFFGRYVTTFDFQNNALYLRKGKRFDVATEHDMSGLHFVRSKDLVMIAIVDDRSAAALAGVKVDDELLQVNQLKSEGADLWDLRDELSSGDGKPIRLRLRRDGVTRAVKFNLKKAI